MDDKNTENMPNQSDNTENIASPPPPEPQNTPEQPIEPTAPAEDPGYQVPVTSPQQPQSKKKWLKWLITLIAVVVLVVGGWLIYKQLTKDDSVASTAQNKNIERLSVGISAADYGELYPNMAPNSYSYLVNGQMFEGLVRYEEKSKIVPLLATDWTNPDNTTWVFNLKENVQFHNGNTMTAEDVKYSIETIKSSESDFAGIFTDTIESVEAISDNQVQIKTASPDPALLNRLTFLYVIDSNAPEGSEASMAGTGPYHVRPGSETTKTNVDMIAFEDYHGPAPTTKAVNFGTEETTQDLLAAFREGKYNIVGNMPVDEAENAEGAHRFISSEPDVAFIGLNSVAPGPLQDKSVREAVRYAVDPIKLAEAEGDKATPLSQLIPNSIPGHNNAVPTYERDVEKAKELLAQAGYEDGVTLNFYHVANTELADELKKQLKEANITLEVHAMGDFDQFINQFNNGRAEMYYVIYASDILDGLDVYNTLLSPANYSNSELTEVLEQADAATNPADRLKLLQEAAVMIDQDVAVVPLSMQDGIWLMDRDYDMVQDLPSSFLSVYFSKVQLK